MKQSERLAMLERVITAARGVDPEAAEFLATGLHLATIGAVTTLDQALGIRGPGLPTIGSLARLAERDRHLKAAFDRIPFDEDTSHLERVRELAREVSLFESTTWRWARQHAEPPPRLSSMHAEIWHALKCGSVPTSEQRLRRILAAADRETPGFHD